VQRAASAQFSRCAFINVRPPGPNHTPTQWPPSSSKLKAPSSQLAATQPAWQLAPRGTLKKRRPSQIISRAQLAPGAHCSGGHEMDNGAPFRFSSAQSGPATPNAAGLVVMVVAQ